MNKLQKLLIVLSLISFVSVFYSCDGIFPTAPKSGVPSDHNNNISGFLHKGTGKDLTPNKCEPCHTTDIRGKVSLINGVYTWSSSCYQCHGALWNRNGTNSNN